MYRSPNSVDPKDGRGLRAAVTTIYFLLPKHAVSRWHRVQSDEIWHFYHGAALDLWVADAQFERVDRLRLGPLRGEHRPVWPVPAGSWQAARSKGLFTLVGCTVGPGFDFGDFSLASDQPAAAAALRSRHPDLEDLL